MQVELLTADDMRIVDEEWGGFQINDAFACVKVVDGSGIMRGAAYLRPIIESVMVLDPSTNKFTKIKATKELLEFGYWSTRKAGADQMHAFVQDLRFADHLKTRHGFNLCKGQALVKEL